MQKSYNIGEVSGTNLVGGVCGSCGLDGNSGTVQESYNTGTVSGTYLVGGVCGQTQDDSILQKSYNTGTVSGKGDSCNFIGGVCGKNRSTVTECYNTGNVSGTGQVGGVCGFNDEGGTVSNCYYLEGTSDKPFGDGSGENCGSKTKLQFQNGAVAYQMQSDLGTAEQVWGQKIGTNASPVLAWQTDDYRTVYYPESGTHPCNGGYSNSADGTLQHKYENSVCIYCGEPASEDIVDGYYQIATADQLRQFAEKVNSGNNNIKAKLVNDIKLNGDTKVLNDKGELIADTSGLKSWTPIGKDQTGKQFTGEFDGDGHTIYGLYFNNSNANDSNANDVGLFGCVGKDGTVKNVTLADSYVSGNEYVGGICGRNKGGTLQNCHTTGTVSGSWYVGGVCGYNSGTLKESDNTGTVSGTGNRVGGVCGVNERTLKKSYNTGDVTGNDSVGGVCGDNQSTVNGCYTTGKVIGNAKVGSLCGYISGYGGTVEKCYYLVGTSEKAFGDEHDGVNCASKTKLQFQNGEVAYLLQGTNTEPTWGQTLGKNASPVLAWQKDDYKQVYETAPNSPCPGGYSNTAGQELNHHYVDGKCFYCGQPEIAYTVTIPATVELGNTVKIEATGVTLPNDKQLNVKVAKDSKFEVALGDDTRPYTVTKGEAKTPVNPNDTVLTVESSGTGNSVELTFTPPKTTTYSGTYTGTVTFTVSVDDNSAS